MSDTRLLPVDNSLICAAQGLGIEVDCSSQLISDGRHWSCPYGHIQGFDGRGNPVRKIVDRRSTLKKEYSVT